MNKTVFDRAGYKYNIDVAQVRGMAELPDSTLALPWEIYMDNGAVVYAATPISPTDWKAAKKEQSLKYARDLCIPGTEY